MHTPPRTKLAGALAAITFSALPSLASHPEPASPELIAELADAVTPIPTHDGSWLAPYIADQRVVLIGEETHGIAQHLTLKAELATYLLENHAFTHIALEDDVFKAVPINANLHANALHRMPSPAADTMGRLFWCWNVQELSAYFDSLVHAQNKPTIVGFDVQTPAFAIASLRHKAVTPEQQHAVDKIEALFEPGRDAYALSVKTTGMADRATVNELSAVFPETQIQRERHHLHRVLNLWTVGNDTPRRMNARDEGMAESVMDILGADPANKVIVFAHNAHIGYERFYHTHEGGVLPLGAHLKQRVSTLSIGAVFATGSTLLDPRARDANGGPVLVITSPEPGTQAELWDTLDHDRWLLDPVSASATPAVAEFLADPPAGYFNNFGPARPLSSTYDLIVGYRTVSPGTPQQK